MSKKECYLCCEEEGPATYFFVQNIDLSKIRFIHISDRRHDIEGLATENFKIRQDFITTKYNFVNQFYNCLREPILNVTEENLKDSMFSSAFNEFRKDSEIVKKYLELYNC